MNYTVKKQEYEGPKGYNIPEVPDVYDFYAPEVLKDELTGEEITRNKKVASHSLEELERLRAGLSESLADITNKIDLITALK